jgi:putative ABC transport system substrate-binding protein
MNNRRKLLIAFGAGVFTAPLAAAAQQPERIWRIGVLYLLSRQSAMNTGRYVPFVEGMRNLGYIENKNLLIEWRFADGKSERLPALAAELLKSKVDLIVSAGTTATSAARKATSSVPIVMANASDPVASGLIKSLAHPGGNVTGLSSITDELGPKHLEMLQSMMPKLSRVAVMTNPDNSSHIATLRTIQNMAPRTGIKILSVRARTPQEIEAAFLAISRERGEAVIVASDSFFIQQRRETAELCAKYHLASISARREYAEAGFLMSYGQNSADNYRRAAIYVDKIFKGAKPAELPVEQPTKFELFINAKTARALGVKIPDALTLSADKVIE